MIGDDNIRVDIDDALAHAYELLLLPANAI
jgi:hypothetical protein